MNISLSLQMAADTGADRVALVCDGRRWSYGALYRAAQGAARSMRASKATHVALLDESSSLPLIAGAAAGLLYVESGRVSGIGCSTQGNVASTGTYRARDAAEFCAVHA